MRGDDITGFAKAVYLAGHRAGRGEATRRPDKYDAWVPKRLMHEWLRGYQDGQASA